MDRKFENIINEGKKNGKTMSEINAELKAAGATFHLDYKMCEDGPVTGWTEKEMEEGFIPAETTEKPARLSDFYRRNQALAGKSITVKVVEGEYKITYNEEGYHTKAVKV